MTAFLMCFLKCKLYCVHSANRKIQQYKILIRKKEITQQWWDHGISANTYRDIYIYTPIYYQSQIITFTKSKGHIGRREEEANSLHPMSKYSKTYGVLWNLTSHWEILKTVQVYDWYMIN